MGLQTENVAASRVSYTFLSLELNIWITYVYDNTMHVSSDLSNISVVEI